MTALTPRQRIKMNAALTLISCRGHNANNVTKAARGHMSRGRSAADAYGLALNEYVARQPAMLKPLSIALDLVQASDDATLAKYDTAINHYNNTGDDSQLEALTPMIVQDSAALAVRNGEVSAADAQGWDIYEALGVDNYGYDDTPAGIDAAEPRRSASAEPQTSSFQFANAINPAQVAPAPSEAPSAPSGFTPTGYRPSLAKQAQAAPQGNHSDPTQPSRSATGYRPGMAGEKARQWHGTPMGDVQYVRTATGFRPAPTGEQARREAGVPLGPDA